MKLGKEIGIYNYGDRSPLYVQGYKAKKHTVTAFFRGELQIVFEGINHSECVKYCHNHGLRIMGFSAWDCAVNASFRKVNAKKRFDVSDYQIGTVS